MKKYKAFLAPILLFVVLILSLYAQTLDDLPYSRAKALIISGEVASARLDGSRMVIVTNAGANYDAQLPPEDPTLIAALDAAGVPYTAQSTPSDWVMKISPAFTGGMIVLTAILAVRRIKGATGSKDGRPGRERVTFDDVAGYEEVKEELREIVECLHDPGKYARLGARTPKGVLLEGPPGTGKTFLARAVAGEAGVRFLSVDGTSFNSIFVSQAGTELRRLFEKAKNSAPCIIFIDEIDALAAARHDSVGTSQREFDNTLITLLTLMDGFDPAIGVIVMAATNRAGVLDPAVLRPGRFDRHVQVGLPDERARQAILRQYAARVPCAADVDLAHLAVLTVGLAGAHLENLVNEAALIATRRGAGEAAMSDFQQALERAYSGIGTPHRLNAEDRYRVAVHESGHALAAAAAGIGNNVRKVTILGHGTTLGHNLVIPEEGDGVIQTRRDLLREIWMLHGGTAAEELVFGERSSGAESDLTRVERVVDLLVTRFGLGESLPHRGLNPKTKYPPELIERIEAEKDAIARDCYLGVAAALVLARPQLDRMVEILLAHDSLGGKDLQEILSRIPVVHDFTRPS